MPESVIQRAKKILADLESGKPQPSRKKQKQEEPQLTLVPEETALEKRIRSIDINTLTPIDSMNILFELIKMAKS